MNSKILSLLLVGLGTFTLCSCDKNETKKDERFLSCFGSTIVNGKNQKVLLKGVNLGGWLHMEGWMDGGGKLPPSRKYVWANHHAVLSELESRFSYQQVESLLETYQKAYIQKSDFEQIASLGLNFVRIPFFWREILDNNGNVKANAFDQLDFAVNTCKELGIYVMLDLHGAPGGHTGGWETGGIYDSNKLWYDPTSLDWTKKIWRTIASHYKNNYVVAAYDLLNEPVVPSESDIKEDIPEGAKVYTKQEMYDLLYKEVRNIDKDHIISMGAFFNFDALGDPKAHKWENVIYQTHHYDDVNKTVSGQLTFTTSQLNYIYDYQQKWRVPCLAGEFSFWDATEAWNSWYTNLNRLNISWCSWTYKNTATDPNLNWGFYHMPNVEYPDYENDSYEQIKNKWANFITANYTKNEILQNIVINAQKKLSILPLTNFDIYSSCGEGAMRISDGILFGDSSRYTTSAAQKDDGSQYLEISFKNQIPFNRIDIFTANHDFSNNFKLEYYDGSTYKEIYKGSGNCGDQIINIDESIVTSKVKITNLSNSANWWSIHEVSFFVVSN